MSQSKPTTGDQTGEPAVALIPAAGHARRLGRLPCSKEIYPLGRVAGKAGAPARSKAVCEHLLEALSAAGIATGYMVLRPGKWDIPAYLESLEERGLDLAYLTIAGSRSVPETLDRAYPFVRGRRVALGFPDILFRPVTAYRDLLERQARSRAAVVLALFPTDQDERSDMVEVDGAGAVRRLVIKRPPRGLRYTWSAAVWGPQFSDYLHRYAAETVERSSADGSEPSVGDAIQAALDDGLGVEAVVYEEGETLDIGTPESLRRAIERFGGGVEP